MPKPSRMSKPDEYRTKHIVKCIYIGLSRGWSYQQIADRLNDKNIKTLRGCSWNYLSVQQVVSVIHTAKASWYKWAYDLLARADELPLQGLEAA